MSAENTVRTILEFMAIILAIYGLTHEDKFIALEDKIIERLRNR